MSTKTIITRTSKMWLGNDRIVRNVMNPAAEVTPTDAEETLAALLKITGGKKVPLLVHMERMNSIDRQARNLYANADGLTATALLVSSPVSRVIGNFFLGLNRPDFPTRLFTSESEAVTWLKGFLD